MLPDGWVVEIADMMSLPDGWLVEVNPEVEENVERIVSRNGSVYYINDETEENIYLGRVYSEPSGHDMTAPVTRVKPSYRNMEGIRYEFLPQDGWQVNDGMGAWEGRDVGLVYPRRWICNVCNIENHQLRTTCGAC